jgi:hypothetical protein
LRQSDENVHFPSVFAGRDQLLRMHKLKLLDSILRVCLRLPAGLFLAIALLGSNDQALAMAGKTGEAFTKSLMRSESTNSVQQASSKTTTKLGPKTDKAAWEKVRKVNTCAAYHHYLRTFPKGRYVTSSLKALSLCSPKKQRYRGSRRTYFRHYHPYIEPIWPWLVIPVPPVVIIPPEIIDLELELPIAPEPDFPDAVQLPSDDGGFDDGGFDDGGFDDGGFDDGGFDDGGFD